MDTMTELQMDRKVKADRQEGEDRQMYCSGTSPFVRIWIRIQHALQCLAKAVCVHTVGTQQHTELYMFLVTFICTDRCAFSPFYSLHQSWHQFIGNHCWASVLRGYNLLLIPVLCQHHKKGQY